jgi:ribosomal protein S18 acetylase RimI-like enzyme
LVLRPEHYDVSSWPPGEAEKYTPLLEACYDRGGWFYGLFDDRTLVGVVVLDSRFIGTGRGQLQLTFLHISNQYRDHGFGKQLFRLAARDAWQRGAKRLYISATPSERTVNFYLRLGCKVASEPDPELFVLEPEDIHLEGEV